LDTELKQITRASTAKREGGC